MAKVGYKNKVHHPPEPKKRPRKSGPKVKPGPKTNGKKAKERLPSEHKNIDKNQKPIQKSTFPNYKGLNEKEFYEALAKWADSYDKQRMERYTRAFAEVIIHELVYNDEIRVPYLGTFCVQKYKGYEYETKDFGGKPRKVKVPPRSLPVFVPCDSLLNDVNDFFRTDEYKRRERRGELSWRDYTRELRHELWEAEDEAIKQNNEEAQEKAKKLQEKFKKTLTCRDVRGLEKIMNIEDVREEQLQIKKERKERKIERQREMEDE